jgi:serine/threonine protein kinase
MGCKGTTIDGRFELLQELGKGGMGTVYRARQKGMDRCAAVKVLNRSTACSAADQRRLRNEARAISVLAHPNIVSIYTTGITEDGKLYLAMELLAGRSLAAIIEETGFLPWEAALPLFIQACDALDHAHANQIIHRDIKPSNMIVTAEVANPCLKLVDFGIAKMSGEEGTISRATQILGSAAYLSPEIAAGQKCDRRSDIYALGCSLFHTLAGSPPFSGETFWQTAYKHRNDPVPSVNAMNARAHIPDSLQQVIDCCLSKDPSKRFVTTKHLQEDLQAVLAGKPPKHVTGHHTFKPAPELSQSLKHRILAAATGGVLLVLVALSSATWFLQKEYVSSPDLVSVYRSEANAKLIAARRLIDSKQIAEPRLILQAAAREAEKSGDPLLRLDVATNLIISCHEAPDSLTGAEVLLLKSITDVQKLVDEGRADAEEGNRLLFFGYTAMCAHYIQSKEISKFRDFDKQALLSLQAWERSPAAHKQSRDIIERQAELLFFAIKYLADDREILQSAERLFALQRRCHWPPEEMSEYFADGVSRYVLDRPGRKQILSKIVRLIPGDSRSVIRR